MRSISLALSLTTLTTFGCAELFAKPDPKVTGRVAGVRAGTGEVLNAVATVVLTNGAAKDLTVKKYKIVWQGGGRKVSGDFRIPHGGQSTLTETIVPKDGDITRFIEGTASPTIQILETAE